MATSGRSRPPGPTLVSPWSIIEYNLETSTIGHIHIRFVQRFIGLEDEMKLRMILNQLYYYRTKNSYPRKHEVGLFLSDKSDLWLA